MLDVEQTAARAVRLGPHVTVVRIPEGLHDLTLSAPHVRKQALDEIGRFVEAYVKRGDARARMGLLEAVRALIR